MVSDDLGGRSRGVILGKINMVYSENEKKLINTLLINRRAFER